jgi:hypothetical protein
MGESEMTQKETLDIPLIKCKGCKHPGEVLLVELIPYRWDSETNEWFKAKFTKKEFRYRSVCCDYEEDVEDNEGFDLK